MDFRSRQQRRRARMGRLQHSSSAVVDGSLPRHRHTALPSRMVEGVLGCIWQESSRLPNTTPKTVRGRWSLYTWCSLITCNTCRAREETTAPSKTIELFACQSAPCSGKEPSIIISAYQGAAAYEGRPCRQCGTNWRSVGNQPTSNTRAGNQEATSSTCPTEAKRRCSGEASIAAKCSKAASSKAASTKEATTSGTEPARTRMGVTRDLPLLSSLRLNCYILLESHFLSPPSPLFFPYLGNLFRIIGGRTGGDQDMGTIPRT